MKGRLVLFFICLSPILTFGQDAYDRYTNFFAVEVAPVASSAGIAVVPTFSMYRVGHKIYVGAHINLFDVCEDGVEIMGEGYFGYKFFPNQRKNTFNLYFGYHTIFSASDRGKKIPVIVNQTADTRKYPNKAF